MLAALCDEKKVETVELSGVGEEGDHSEGAFIFAGYTFVWSIAKFAAERSITVTSGDDLLSRADKVAIAVAPARDLSQFAITSLHIEAPSTVQDPDSHLRIIFDDTCRCVSCPCDLHNGVDPSGLS